MHNKTNTKTEPNNQWEAHQTTDQQDRPTALERTAA